MTKWGERYIWAGLYRRYERDELKQKIKDSGLKINRIFNYGWPISVLLKSLRENVYRRKNRKQEGIFSDSDRTYRSGIERSTELKTFPLYDNFLGRLFFSVLYVFQKLFFNFEWGDGYIVIAHKKLNDSIIG